MKAVNPYLNFLGNTEDAFNFYKSIFGGEFAMVMRFKDTDEAGKVAPEDANKLMHISLPIGNGNVLMGSDMIESMRGNYRAGNNFYLSLSMDSKEEADKVFGGLSGGGMVAMPMADTFWGSYFGMCTDKFGTNWMISYDAQR